MLSVTPVPPVGPSPLPPYLIIIIKIPMTIQMTIQIFECPNDQILMFLECAVLYYTMCDQFKKFKSNLYLGLRLRFLQYIA